VNFLDRAALVVVARQIQAEFRLNAKAYQGSLTSSGWRLLSPHGLGDMLADRIGVRRGMTLCLTE
jgi:hypothetical protein